MRTFATGNSPTGLAIDPTLHTGFVINSLDETVTSFATPTAPIIVSSAALPELKRGGAVNFQVSATGFPAPTFSLLAAAGSSIPQGLNIDPATGLLNGTITADPATYSFDVVADNRVDPASTQLLTLTVTAVTTTPPPVTPTAPPTTTGTGAGAGGNGNGGSHLASTGTNTPVAVASGLGASALLIGGAALLFRKRQRCAG